MVSLVATACTGDNPPKDGPTSTAENTLDDATIEQGDVHTIEITGGPTAGMMSLGHPEVIINARRMRTRVTVVCLSVCLSVCLLPV